MAVWEHATLTISPTNVGDLARRMDTMGKQGWELVQVLLVAGVIGSTYLAFFKRKVTQS